MGVSAALAADRWNSRRVGFERETEYVLGLRSDFIDDTLQIQSSLEGILARASAAEALFEWATGGPPPENIADALFRAGDDGFLSLTSPVYSDLLQSGNLGIIRNTGFRSAFTSYYQDIDILIPQMRQLELEGPVRARAVTWELLPFDPWKAGSFLDFDGLGLAADTAEVRSRLRGDTGALSMSVAASGFQRAVLTGLLRQAREVIHLADADLARRGPAP